MVDLETVITAYLKDEDRKKWLLLRRLAYEQLINKFLGSPNKLDELSEEDFKKYFLSFCKVFVDGVEYNLTTENLSNFFERYNQLELEDLARSRRIKVIGNASWTQLHMGFKLGKWKDQKRCIKYVLFGDDGKSLGEISEDIIIKRIEKVLEGRLATKGFGRAKITPLLLICDPKDRFGVWNGVSNKTLESFKLKSKSNITRRRKLADYLEANRALNELKTRYGFENLADVDLFMWHALEETSPPKKEPQLEPTKESEIPIDIKNLTHTQVQGLLLELGNMLGYDTYVADPSKPYKDITLGEIAKLGKIPSFTYSHILNIVKNIDVIWFKGEYPDCCFEVEHTTNVRDGLLRLYQISPLKGVRFFIIAPSSVFAKFKTEVSRRPFKEIKERYKFRSYDRLLRFIKEAKIYHSLKSDFVE